MRNTGDPQQTYAGVRVLHVVLALRDLEPGFHTVAEVRDRYLRMIDGAKESDLPHVAAIVTRFGMKRHQVKYREGWTIDPVRLARNWPRLPWPT